MATDKGKGARRSKGKGKGEGGYGGGGRDDELQGPGKHSGAHAVPIHEAYLKRHIDGGRPPTPEAYEDARRQFRRLPGAVRVPPTTITRSDTAQVEEEAYDAPSEGADK